MKIGLDFMGGDFSPNNCLEGTILALKELNKDVTVVLIGDSAIGKAYFAEKGISMDQIEFVHTDEVIDMCEHPTKAISKKPNSSIAVGFKLLKENVIQCFASAGNTGAMLVGAMFSVKPIPGVIRPCITSVLPKMNGGVNIILDVGTNADCRPDVLVQFGLLGSIYAQNVHKIDNPKVGLLNIGEEPEKGNLVSQAAYTLMKQSTGFNFIGNIEGSDLFSDKVDVIVCEGFTGNVLLKMAESFYSMIKKRNRSDEFFDRFNYELYGGTPILGVHSNVLIAHGKSSPVSFKNLLLLSQDLCTTNLTDKIKLYFNNND